VFDPTEAIREMRARSTLPRSYVKSIRHIHDILVGLKKSVYATELSSRRAISEATPSRVSCASTPGNTAGTSNFRYLGEVRPRSGTTSLRSIPHVAISQPEGGRNLREDVQICGIGDEWCVCLRPRQLKVQFLHRCCGTALWPWS
jgi:hypothetical protein